MPIELQSPSRLRYHRADISFGNATFQIPTGNDDFLMADDGGTFLEGVNGDITLGTPISAYSEPARRTVSRLGGHGVVDDVRGDYGDLDLDQLIAPRKDRNGTIVVSSGVAGGLTDNSDEQTRRDMQMEQSRAKVKAVAIQPLKITRNAQSPPPSPSRSSVLQERSDTPSNSVSKIKPVSTAAEEASRKKFRDSERQASSIRAPDITTTFRRQVCGTSSNTISVHQETEKAPRNQSPADDMFERMKRDTYLQKGVELSAHSTRTRDAVKLNPMDGKIQMKSRNLMNQVRNIETEETGVILTSRIPRKNDRDNEVIVRQDDCIPDGHATDIAYTAINSIKTSNEDKYGEMMAHSTDTNNVMTGLPTSIDNEDNVANTSTSSNRGIGTRLVEYGQKIVDSIGLFSSHNLPITAEPSTIIAATSTSTDNVPSQPGNHQQRTRAALSPKKSKYDKSESSQAARRRSPPLSPMRPSTKRPLGLNQQRNEISGEIKPFSKKTRGNGASSADIARDIDVGRVGTELTGTGQTNHIADDEKEKGNSTSIDNFDYSETAEKAEHDEGVADILSPSTFVPQCDEEDHDQVRVNFVGGSTSSGPVEIVLRKSAHVNLPVNHAIAGPSNAKLPTKTATGLLRTSKTKSPRHPRHNASRSTLSSRKLASQNTTTTRTRRQLRQVERSEEESTTTVKREKENAHVKIDQKIGGLHTEKIPLGVTSAPQKPNLTVPKEFRFQCNVESEIHRKEFEEKLKTWQNRAAAHHPVPDFKSLHAAHEAELALRRKKVVPVLPVQHVFSTDIRVREREKFDEERKARELEAEKQLQERNHAEEEELERQWREMRKKTVPKANAIPEWYADAPKRFRS